MGTSQESIRAAKIFEFYVKHVWPFHRILVKGKFSRRCQNCAASEKMIPLEGNGRCQVCNEGSVKKPASVQPVKDNLTVEMNEVLRKSQRAGKGRYDALCLFSGGKDSTYMIHRIRTEFPGIRMLAYTIDNSYMSSVAKENVDEMLQKLKIDHIFVRPDPRFYKNLFRYAFTHLNEDGGYGTLDFSDGEFMLDTARAIAAEKQIPLILCGYSKYQVQNGLKLHHFESPRERETSNRTETAGLRLSDVFSPADVQRWWHGREWPADQVARLLFPLYAWNLEEFEIKQKVTEWGLLTEKEYSPVVTNHQLIPLLGIVDVHKFGYSSFEPEFCRMIREGKARRDEWQHVFEFLEYTARTGLFMKNVTMKLLADLDLNLNDVGVKFE